MKAVKFLSVGLVGLLVDSTMFLLLQWFGVELLLSRLLAFWAAVCTTYIGNTAFTFNRSASNDTFISYFLAMHLTGFFNLALFSYLTLMTNTHVNIAFVIGILLGTILNYGFSKRILES